MINWYYQSGKESDVVLNTMVRIARNISGINFTRRFNDDDAFKVLNKVKNSSVAKEYNLKYCYLKDMDEISRNALVEKHIARSHFINNNIEERGFLINDDENIALMLNDEEHINMHILSSGLDIENTFDLAMEIENKLDNELVFSYNNTYGYLTESPVSVGTGLKILITVHLPALTKTQNINKILEVVRNFGVNINGIHGDGIKNKGNKYIISNKQTLGISEKDIIKNIKGIVEKVVEQERLARKILAKKSIDFEDSIYRSYGILTNAKKISIEEAKNLISDVRLGVDMGIIKEINDLKVNKLDILTKPANLQKFYGEKMDIFDIDIKRAELIKKIVKED